MRSHRDDQREALLALAILPGWTTARAARVVGVPERTARRWMRDAQSTAKLAALDDRAFQRVLSDIRSA